MVYTSIAPPPPRQPFANSSVSVSLHTVQEDNLFEESFDEWETDEEEEEDRLVHHNHNHKHSTRQGGVSLSHVCRIPTETRMVVRMEPSRCRRPSFPSSYSIQHTLASLFSSFHSVLVSVPCLLFLFLPRGADRPT